MITPEDWIRQVSDLVKVRDIKAHKAQEIRNLLLSWRDQPGNHEMKNYNNAERFYIHCLCDQLEIPHVSLTIADERMVVITIPNNYILKAPSKSKMQHTQQNSFTHGKRQRKCTECNVFEDDEQLYVHYAIQGIYCQACIENEFGDDGFTAHKWEEI